MQVSGLREGSSLLGLLVGHAQPLLTVATRTCRLTCANLIDGDE